MARHHANENQCDVLGRAELVDESAAPTCAQSRAHIAGSTHLEGEARVRIVWRSPSHGQCGGTGRWPPVEWAEAGCPDTGKEPIKHLWEK